MRYFARLSYKGTQYAGWQRQPNHLSVQEVLEERLSLILKEDVEITGCGRTDSGVHAENYIAHLDASQNPQEQLRRINKFLPEDIAMHQFWEVPSSANARFDAISRSYRYDIIGEKNPFRSELSWYFQDLEKLNLTLMQEAAHLLTKYVDFAPFCKTNSSAHTMKCTITEARWVSDKQKLSFYISANRFLRGMVRLIVGMCIYVGQGKMKLEEVMVSMDQQIPLPQPLSAPAHGLFLRDIKYPVNLLPID